MKSWKLSIVAGVFLIAAPAGAQPAEFGDGNGILQACTSEEHSDAMACAAFIQGFVMGAGASAFDAERQVPFCVPANATVGEVIDIIVQGLRAAPRSRHLDGSVLVMMLMQRAFPCAPSNSN